MDNNTNNVDNKEAIKVSIYNPSLQAFQEISLEDAEKFLESAKEVEKIINELKNK